MNTTKRVLYVRADNSFGFSKLNLNTFDAITGKGGLKLPSEIDWEIAKQVRGVPPDQLERKLDIATRWANALAFGGLTEAAALQLIHDKADPLNEVRTAFVEAAALASQDSYFRAALECDVVGTVSCNMVKARVVHMNQIRRVRNLELAKHDWPYVKALEKQDTVEMTRIAGLKQVLRDIPQTFDLLPFTTPQTLKAAWPSGLPK